jgi:hypothetical protein
MHPHGQGGLLQTPAMPQGEPDPLHSWRNPGRAPRLPVFFPRAVENTRPAETVGWARTAITVRASFAVEAFGGRPGISAALR